MRRLSLNRSSRPNIPKIVRGGGVHSASARPSRLVLGFLTKTVAGRRAAKYGQKADCKAVECVRQLEF